MTAKVMLICVCVCETMEAVTSENTKDNLFAVTASTASSFVSIVMT